MSVLFFLQFPFRANLYFDLWLRACPWFPLFVPTTFFCGLFYLLANWQQFFTLKGNNQNVPFQENHYKFFNPVMLPALLGRGRVWFSTDSQVSFQVACFMLLILQNLDSLMDQIFPSHLSPPHRQGFLSNLAVDGAIANRTAEVIQLFFAAFYFKGYSFSSQLHRTAQADRRSGIIQS